jgi:hypothetical protein
MVHYIPRMGWLWRRPPAEAHPLNAVYAWPTSKGYYAEKVVPRRLDLRAKPADLAEEVCARLPATVRGFLFHIDVTETGKFPLDRARLIEELRARSIRVLNAQVTNIAKRTVHAVVRQLALPCALAPREGDERELLIVKTDRNYGGRNERWLSRRDRRLLGLADGSADIRGAFDYKLVSRADVPSPWWDDPDLVVERFITNRDHRLHRVHVVLNHFAFWSGVSPLPIKKIRDCSDTHEHFLRRGQLEPGLPPALLRTAYDFAEAFSLDYGALDLIADEAGRYYVIDANSTPWRGTESPERIAFLRAAWDAGPLDAGIGGQRGEA